ncbi:hypothetical protein L6164_002798 [Bauhinia variegata]|uniref:Uncharacterized protein n=1 Tax=Bauhinia variegata TaxID=167791 RepID=A0ACB9PYS5_BAUVA|nr:hypothetical protein L6164_002798 [Bauhinia variegata]
MLAAECSHKFHFVNASASPLPLHQFLAAHHYEPSSLPALLSLGAYPDITADILQLLQSPSLIVTNSIGIDHIDLLECRCRGVQVANAGTVFSEDVLHVAVGLLIDVTRKQSLLITDLNYVVDQRYVLGSGQVYYRPEFVWSGSGSNQVECLELQSTQKKTAEPKRGPQSSLSEVGTAASCLRLVEMARWNRTTGASVKWIKALVALKKPDKSESSEKDEDSILTGCLTYLGEWPSKTVGGRSGSGEIGDGVEAQGRLIPTLSDLQRNRSDDLHVLALVRRCIIKQYSWLY